MQRTSSKLLNRECYSVTWMIEHLPVTIVQSYRYMGFQPKRASGGGLYMKQPSLTKLYLMQHLYHNCYNDSYWWLFRTPIETN